MKRIIALMLALMLAVSFSGFSFGAEITLIVKNNPSDSAYDDDDYRVEPYEFATLTEALAFALDPDEVETPENFTDVTIDIQKNISLGDGDEEVSTLTLSDYDNEVLTKLKLTGRNTITASSNERHIIADNSNVEFELSGLTLRGNEGGGVSVMDGTVVINGVTFQGIDATKNSDSDENNGGAMNITGGSVSFTGTNNFTGNTAENGGAIFIASNNDVNFEGSFTFENNTANSDGGAIYLSDASGVSSSMYNHSVNASMYNNSVVSSKLIIWKPGITSVTGSFKGNSAANGGAIFITSGGTAEFNGAVTFDGNRAVDNGGAIYVRGRFTDNNSSLIFRSNHAGTTIYTTTTTDPTSTGLPTTGFGGAMYFDSAISTESNFGQTEFHSNTAPLGGAIYVNRGTVNFNNTALFGTSGGNESYIGGALYLNGGNTNFNSSVSFDKNIALDHGGAIYTVQNGTETLNFTSSVTFSNNIANYDSGNLGNGGAVWWGLDVTTVFSSTFNVSGTGSGVTFTGNKIQGTGTTPSSEGNGGAIYIANSGTLTIDTNIDYQFSGNTAWNKGGVIYTETANVTFSGVTISAQNTATNVGGGLVASATGLIRFENSIVTLQQAYAGGAVYATNIEIVESSDFTKNSSTTAGGGAVYASPGGKLTITNSTFAGNNAQTTGGAIFADASTITITEAYFQNNSANSNGGAIEIENECTSIVRQSTFEGNQSGGGGGAIRPYGNITISESDFNGNYASLRGGAVFFSQSGSGKGIFKISSSMLRGNIAGGIGTEGRGGALCLDVDDATIESCTFDSNAVTGGSSAYGGAVYLDVSGALSTKDKEIINCTFVTNQVMGGSTNNYGGGLYVAGDVTIKSSAFTLGNTATDAGGGIYVSTGKTRIMATIIVGNNANLGSDIYSVTDTDTVVDIFNRVGIYGTGGNNDPYKFTINDSQQDPSWNTATFYSNNVLANNGDAPKPPLVGAPRSGSSLLLQTLMLDEDDNLPLDSTAIDIIHWAFRFQLPQYDQRGVSRWENRDHIDIGPVCFGSGKGDPSEPITTYDIESIMISGIPNSLRSIGQTASLIAMIRYTNGRTAYGGDDEGSEPIEWHSDKQNIVRIDQKGNITALATTPNNSYVTISVSTNRNKPDGTPATDSRPVRVLGQYSYLNISTVYQNYLASYLQELAEHDIAISLADVNSSTISSSSFQRLFKSVWDADKAAQITELNTSTPSFNTLTSYSASGYTPSKNAAANINFQDRTNGDIFPLVYTWNFSGSEIKNLTGYDLSDKTLNASFADELFKSFRIDFQGASKVFQVVGGSGVSASEAYKSEALTLTKADGNKGVSVSLTAYLANVNAAGSNADGPQLMGIGSRKLLIVPDGTNDGAITGSMWMIQKSSSSGNDNSNDNNDNNGNGNNNNNGNGNNGNGNSDSSSGGGGGCNSLGLGLLGLLLIFKRK